MHRRVAAAACLIASRCVGLNSISIIPQATINSTSSALLCFGHPELLAHAAAATFQPGLRRFSSLDVSKEMDAVNELFVEARDEIEFAKEEGETVYFDESVQTAKKAVEQCLARWEGLLAALSEEERNRVVRTMGLKMAQLQAEFDEVSKLHLEE